MPATLAEVVGPNFEAIAMLSREPLLVCAGTPYVDVIRWIASGRSCARVCAPTTVGGATADLSLPQVRYGAWVFSQERREATARPFK